MLQIALRAAAVGITLVCAGLLSGAAPAASPEDARIEQAIQDYTNQQKAEQEKARDALVAGKRDALVHDPATQSLGNPNGDVELVEFFDYTCPFCKAAEPRIQELLKTDRGVKLIVKEFPILQPESIVASKAALASAKQGKYAAYHQAMMNFKGKVTEEVIFDIAKDTGLDVARLKQDMNAPEIADAIIANFNLARALRIFDTPTFVIGGHVVTTPSTRIDFPKLVADERAK